MIFVECDNTFFPNNVSPNQHALYIIFIKNFALCTMLRKISMLCEACLLRILLCVPCFARLACFVENLQQDKHLYSVFKKISNFSPTSALCSLFSKTTNGAFFVQHIQEDYCSMLFSARSERLSLFAGLVMLFQGFQQDKRALIGVVQQDQHLSRILRKNSIFSILTRLTFVQFLSPNQHAMVIMFSKKASV